MPSRRAIDPEVELRVRQRAKGLCEYCHAAERWQYVRFTVDHVAPIAAGGGSGADNLALACFHCNRRKWDRVSAIDPYSGSVVPLFDPRRDAWPEHFTWSSDGVRLFGLSATGRASVEALQMNRERVLLIRAADLAVERHPPDGDPIEGH